MALRIRDFTTDDYEAALAVHTAAEPEYPETVEEWVYWETHREPRTKWARFLAERNGEVVGVATYSQPATQYHPRKFHLSVMVHPAHERQGIGSALHEHLVRAVAPFEPIQLNIETREDRPHALRFLKNRGYVERMREWESRLDLAAFDANAFAQEARRVETSGVELRTFGELRDTDPHYSRKLHTLRTALERDVPSIDEPTETDFDTWQRRLLNNPGLLPDGWIVAVDGDDYVGESQVVASRSGQFLEVGLTAVRREYRRRGIAFAMKVKATAHGAELARTRGFRELRTWNATTNEGMLAINQRLGFKRAPAWIFYTRQEAAL